MSLFPGRPGLDPTNRGLRERIFSYRTMEVGHGDLSGDLRVFLGRVSQPGWILDSIEYFSWTETGADAVNYWLLQPKSIEGPPTAPVYRLLDPGLSTATRILPADIGVRIHEPVLLGYKVPVGAILVVDLFVEGTPATLEAPTFQATLSFGG